MFYDIKAVPEDNSNDKIICPICGDDLEVFEYAYDQNQYGKVYYKCNICGHKMNIMK